MSDVADRTSFMALMINNYAKQLEMPSGFVKGMGRRRVDGEYQIRVWGTGGSHCWIVELEKDNNGLFFRKGLPEFLDDNNVGFANVLVFIHEGKNKFLVKIFDPSGLKRNMASMTQNEEAAVEIPVEDNEENDDESMDMDLDEPSIICIDSESECHTEVGGEGEKEKQGFTKPTWGEGMCRMEVDRVIEKEEPNYFEPTQLENSDRFDMKELGREQQKEKHAITEPTREVGVMEKEEHDCDEPTQGEKSGRFDIKATKEHVCVETAPIRFGDEEKESIKEAYLLPPFSVETTRKESMFHSKDKEKESNKEASALPPFSSSHTHFVATWSPTWQDHLTIPKEIAVEKDLNSKSQLVVRDPSGNSWFMKLSTAEDGSINLTGKWFKFCEDWGLKDGDTCTFEFISSRIVHAHISTSA